MTHDSHRSPMTERQVLYTMTGMDAVRVQRDVPYRTAAAGPLTIDLYYPPDGRAEAPAPAVLFVTGFSDAGAERMLGSKFKDMGSFVSWARLAAASGLVGITYANHEPSDAQAALEHVRAHAGALGIDRNRMGIWACSGHGPTALSVLVEHGRTLACAALLYPYTLDLDGTTGVADAAAQFRFATPAAGKTAADLPRDVPLLLVRAGRDEMPGLNRAFDRFVTAALDVNLPVTVVNHANGPHAFDLVDDSRRGHETIRQVLAFLQLQLSA